MRRKLSLSTVLCAGLAMLLSSNAQGQNLFATDATGSIYEFTPSGAQSTLCLRDELSQRTRL